MANEGMLLTFFVSLVGGVAFAMAALEVWWFARRRVDIFLFCLAAALYLLIAGARILFGFGGLHDVDKALFLVVGTPAYLSVVPLVHMAARTLTASKVAIWAATTASLAASLVGLVPFYLAGIDGPSIGFWATEYMFNSPLAGRMLLYGVLIPALAASLVVIFAGFRLERGARKRGVAVGLATLMFFVTLTSDGLAVSGGVLIIERAVMAAAAAMVFVTYRWVDDSGDLRTTRSRTG